MSDLNKAILRVAQTNPNFAKKLHNELLKQAKPVGVFIDTYGNVIIRDESKKRMTFTEDRQQWDRLLGRRKNVVQALKKAGIKHKPLRPYLMVESKYLRWEQNVIVEFPSGTDRDGRVKQTADALDATSIPYGFSSKIAW